MERTRSRRDGLCALCPYFRARCDYRGQHYIKCRATMRFITAEARDRHYRADCCGQYRGCGVYREGREHGQGERANDGDPG